MCVYVCVSHTAVLDLLEGNQLIRLTIFYYFQQSRFDDYSWMHNRYNIPTSAMPWPPMHGWMDGQVVCPKMNMIMYL